MLIIDVVRSQKRKERKARRDNQQHADQHPSPSTTGTKPRKHKPQSSSSLSSSTSSTTREETNQWVQDMNKVNANKSREAVIMEEKKIEPTPPPTEFSELNYWREPIADVNLVELDPLPSQVVKKDEKENSLRKNLSLDNSVWLDKHKFEEAEKKYFEKKQTKTTEVKEKKTESSTKIKSEKTQVKTEQVEDEEEVSDNIKKLKIQAEDYSKENGKLRNDLIDLTQLVQGLQKRIDKLESSQSEVY